MTTEFSSAGFDLDAATGDDSVVLEIGGGATVEPKVEPETVDDADDPLHDAEAAKQRGNTAFLAGQLEQAVELYTEAIEATPGMTAEELLKLQDDFQDEQERSWRRKLAEEDEERRKEAARRRAGRQSSNEAESQVEEPEKETSKPEKKVFEAPPHRHAKELAVYHCNRAAALLRLEQYDAAIRDCSVAILWNPSYAKAYVRRAAAYEKSSPATSGGSAFDEDSGPPPKTDLALADAKKALELEPSNKTIQQTVRRLQKIEDERIEKLKTETMSKLKDLGNSILGNFGLSLDNFHAQQDPNTGSYSISFNQNK